MVLVDTSVWVFHFRQGNSRLEALLNDAEVTTHDFIIGEIACGHLAHRSEILPLLHALPKLPLVTQDEVLSFIDNHRLGGTGIGFVDAHLLASAKLAGVPLWTSDKNLERAAARLKLLYI